MVSSSEESSSILTHVLIAHCPSRGLVAVDDKAEVKEYFNNEGFNRWSRIYSEDAEVNSVQKDIRTGHAQTVDKVLAWVDSDGTAKAGETFWPKYWYVAKELGDGARTEDILKAMEAVGNVALKLALDDKEGPFGFNKKEEDTND